MLPLLAAALLLAGQPDPAPVKLSCPGDKPVYVNPALVGAVEDVSVADLENNRIVHFHAATKIHFTNTKHYITVHCSVPEVFRQLGRAVLIQ